MSGFKKYIVLLGIAGGLMTGCGDVAKDVVNDVSKDISKDTSQIVSQVTDEIVKEIRKKYPLPDPVIINNAHNDTVNYTTTLSVEQVVDFYRQAYAKQGFPEIPEAAKVSSDSAKLVFRDTAGTKSIK